MKIKTAELTGAALDWAVAQCEGVDGQSFMWAVEYMKRRIIDDPDELPGAHHAYEYSTQWACGGPILERENVTIIRADDVYGKDAEGFTTEERIPQWFAETSRWTGHTTTTSYEGEYMEPTFMIGEAEGFYGVTPLIAAMRAYVGKVIGAEVEVPEYLGER